MEYRFAKTTAGEILSISSVNKKNKSEHGPFTCIGCHGEMIPRLGEIKEHHFAHKQTCDCNQETYLHQLAKKLFMQKYQAALVNKTPFIFYVSLPYTCGHYYSCVNKLCRVDELTPYDLTKHFTQIDEEKPVHGVIPDIYLSSENGKEEIFIEMAVTHSCDEKKVALGKRIIEFNIESDRDLHGILNGKIYENTANIKTFNFNKKRKDKDVCKGSCTSVAGLFVIHNSGKVILLDKTYGEICNSSVRGNPKYQELIHYDKHNDPSNIFRDKIRFAYFDKRIDFKNCYLCRYQGLDGIQSAIFCKKHRESCDSNAGATCPDFLPFKSEHLAKIADRKNEEYQSKTLTMRMAKVMFRGIL